MYPCDGAAERLRPRYLGVTTPPLSSPVAPLPFPGPPNTPIRRAMPATALTRAAGLVLLLLAAPAAHAQQPTFTPDDPDLIYERGEPIGWTVEGGTGPLTYVIRRDGGEVLDQGTIDPSSGPTRIEGSLDRPGMLLVEVTRPEQSATPFGDPSTGGPGRILLGAAVDPFEIETGEPEPEDFDAFWAAKIAEMEAIPMQPQFTPKPSGVDGVEYGTVRMRSIQGGSVHAQFAKPEGDGPFPALVILQWASPPYPLEREWVTDRAAEGWMVLNVHPHDVPTDMPAEFYAALPAVVRRYESLGDHSRDESHFLRMYLGDYRGVEYLASRPEWDGRTMVVTGTSMGGQQSFATAALNPRVSGMVVHVPAGADATAVLHGRGASYPHWDVEDPEVLETSRYFDIVNFASRIEVPALVSMGFIDVLTRPTGIWAAFNRLRGPREIVPLTDAPHNHMATQAQQAPYLERAEEWLASWRTGGAPEVREAAATAR